MWVEHDSLDALSEALVLAGHDLGEPHESVDLGSVSEGCIRWGRLRVCLHDVKRVVSPYQYSPNINEKTNRSAQKIPAGIDQDFSSQKSAKVVSDFWVSLMIVLILDSSAFETSSSEIPALIKSNSTATFVRRSSTSSSVIPRVEMACSMKLGWLGSYRFPTINHTSL